LKNLESGARIDEFLEWFPGVPRQREAKFDVLITTDQSLRYQQNLADRKLAILLLPTTSWSQIQGHIGQIVAAVDALNPGDFVELRFARATDSPE
jgi:hypothetical protein